MFCAAPSKYRAALSTVISSRSQPVRTGRLERCGTGTEEKPFRIHAIAASSGVILVVPGGKARGAYPGNSRHAAGTSFQSRLITLGSPCSRHSTTRQ